MTIGLVHITFASPFFVWLAVLVLFSLWHWKRRQKKLFAPHSHAAIKKVTYGKKNLTALAHILIYLLVTLAVFSFAFAALNPLVVGKTVKSFSARKILAVMDVSGSMTIGFDEGSPLPSYEKTRLGRAGIFLRALAEKRKDDAFGIVFFDSEQYVSRDFTQDQSQIVELLTPVNLVGALNLTTIPEAIQIKELAEHKGTWAIQGLEFAKNFIVSHKDVSGDEVIIYIGDLELQSGGIDAGIPQKLAAIHNKHGIKGYAVFIVGDYSTSRSREQTAILTQEKTDVFKDSGIPFYIMEDRDSVEAVAARVAHDIPPSLAQEETVVKKNLAPWFLSAGFALLLLVLVLNERFPRIP